MDEDEEPEEEAEEDDDEEEEAAFDEDAARAASRKLTVTSLRAALEELGETPAGGKAALVEQLVAAQRAAAEAEPEADDDGEDDGLDAWEDHDLQVAVLREVRELRAGGRSRCEFGALAAGKRSSCGVCPAAGRTTPNRPVRPGKFGCKRCKVRICSWRCLNEHLSAGIGKRSNKELVFKEDPDGGRRVPGRSRAAATGPRRVVSVGGRR